MKKQKHPDAAQIKRIVRQLLDSARLKLELTEAQNRLAVARSALREIARGKSRRSKKEIAEHCLVIIAQSEAAFKS